jgi:hypothetical protein
MLRSAVAAASRAGARALSAAGLRKLHDDTEGSRWYILLAIAPNILGSVALRFVLGDLLQLELFDQDTVSAFSNSAIFVIAIMLAGVLEDYKESEGFPAELAAQLDAVSEKLELVELMVEDGEGENKDEEGGSKDSARERFSSRQQHRELLSLCETMFEFLAGLRDDTDMLAAVTVHAKFAARAVHRADCGAVEAGDVLEHFDAIRQTLLRLHVIKRTDFIPSGYSLMELLVWVTMALTCLCKFEGNMLAAYATVVMSALQFFYVIALLRDIDDPFDYEPDTLLPSAEDEGDEAGEGGEGPGKAVVMQGVGSSAEIDQFPLIDAYSRLARIAGVRMGRAPPPSLRDADSGRVLSPTEALAGLSTQAQRDFAARRRGRMQAAFDERDAGRGEAEGGGVEGVEGVEDRKLR